jgi:hypothetical protein
MVGAAFRKESPMNRFKLLLVAVAVLVSTVAGQPAKSDICPGVGVCRDCPKTNPQDPTKQQPCVLNLCTGVYVCTTNVCSLSCVPPS